MTIDTTAFTLTWDLRVKHEDYTAPDGTLFPKTIRAVFWRLTITDPVTGISSQLSGDEAVALPTSPDTFIDLDELLALPRDTRRSAVIGWAEKVNPGFIAAVGDRGVERLVKKIEARQGAVAVADPTVATL